MSSSEISSETSILTFSFLPTKVKVDIMMLKFVLVYCVQGKFNQPINLSNASSISNCSLGTYQSSSEPTGFLSATLLSSRGSTERNVLDSHEYSLS